MIDPALAAVADRFWEEAGAPESFPRALDAAVTWALPLGLIAVPGLSVAWVREWLTQQGAPIRLRAWDRPLRGCLVAYNGHGWVMIDAADPENERRYSFAHEVAHFLLEYYLPRQRALARLGPAILPVLDGQRLANRAERVDAVLADVPIRPLTHLMERRSDGSLACGEAGAEGRADRLALELLAPDVDVRARLSPLARVAATTDVAARAVDLLRAVFGLPLSIAVPYGRALAADLAETRSVRSWLGL